MSDQAGQSKNRTRLTTTIQSILDSVYALQCVQLRRGALRIGIISIPFNIGSKNPIQVVHLTIVMALEI